MFYDDSLSCTNRRNNVALSDCLSFKINRCNNFKEFITRILSNFLI